jgi:hypothetical protein
MTCEDRRKKVLGILNISAIAGLLSALSFHHPHAVYFTAEETELAPA